MEKTMSRRNKKAVRLNELPPELIELLALYLSRYSIRAMKCVSTQINTALHTNRVWKKLLFYPERFYKSDILSESTAVAEVVGELSAGSVGQWQAYYKLQQARLRQWQNGQCVNFHDITLPSNPVDMQEMVDDYGERWFFVVLHGSTNHTQMLHIWNITSTPRFHAVGQTPYTWSKISLLHQGFVVLHCKVTVVYKFKNPDYSLQLWYSFKYDHEKILDHSIPLSPLFSHYESSYVYCVIEDLFIACDKTPNGADPTKNCLHIWRISSGLKLPRVGLPRPAFGVDFFSGQSHNVVIAINYNGLTYITVFNTRTLMFTHIIEVPRQYQSMYVCGDIVCYKENARVRVYTLPTGRTEELVHGQHLKIFKLRDSRVDFKHSKMMIRNATGVLVVSLDSTDLPGVRVNLDSKDLTIVTIIEPNLLVVLDYFHEELKVINTKDSTLLYTWDYFDHLFLFKYHTDFVYPSKFGVDFGNTIRFYAL